MLPFCQEIGYVKKNMTDVEKAMVLHDYLIRKVNYSNEVLKHECLTEAGSLLKNKQIARDMHLHTKCC